MKTKNFNFWLITILCGIFFPSSTQILAQTCTPPPAGMVAWLPGDGNAQDIQNNVQDLSINGGVTFTAGKVAQAFTFDGTGDVTYSNINAGNAYTVDFWMRPSGNGTMHLISNNPNDAQRYGVLRYLGNFQAVEYFQAGSSRVVGYGVSLNTYTHVALTYDGSVNRLYLNGSLVSTSSAHTETFNNQISLGNAIVNANGESRFIGQIDEVEIFSRALSQSEIQEIVNADSAGKCKTPVDADGDGIVDSRDACPNTPSGTTVNASGCPAGACLAPPAGMTNWFPGDGSANDIKGNNNGTANGGVAYSAGKVAQAFTFNGTGDVTYSTINAGSAYTVDFWMLPTSTGTRHLVSNDANSQNYGVLRFVNDRVQYFQSGSVRVESASGSVPLNVYTHIVLTYDGQVNRLYVNGNLAGTSAVHTETFNNPINIGYAIVNANGENRFIGQIDEVEIFSRAISQTEVRGILNADTAGKCRQTPTAASVSISGRVMTTAGRGIRNVRLNLTDSTGETRIVVSNAFGYYRFTDVQAGGTYIISASGKRYVFDLPMRALFVAEETNGINFTALP